MLVFITLFINFPPQKYPPPTPHHTTTFFFSPLPTSSPPNPNRSNHFSSPHCQFTSPSSALPHHNPHSPRISLRKRHKQVKLHLHIFGPRLIKLEIPLGPRVFG